MGALLLAAVADLIATSPLITCKTETFLLFVSSPSLAECIRVPFLVLLAPPPSSPSHQPSVVWVLILHRCDFPDGETEAWRVK